MASVGAGDGGFRLSVVSARDVNLDEIFDEDSEKTRFGLSSIGIIITASDDDARTALTEGVTGRSPPERPKGD